MPPTRASSPDTPETSEAFHAHPAGAAAPRLLKTLDAAGDAACMVLIGPAGCGKSALLQAWSARQQAAGARVLRITGQECAAQGVAAMLAARCVQAEPAIGVSLPPVSRDDPAGAMPYLAIALVRALAGCEARWILVFDDLHALTDPAELKALQILLDYCPPGLQCVFASRAELPLSFCRLRSYGGLLEVGAQRWLWTEDEIAAWLAPCAGMPAASVARRWHALTDGWLAGLHDLRAASAADDADALPAASLHRIQDHVIATLDAESCRALCHLSALEWIDAEIAAALLGRAAPDCAGMLDRVMAEHGFIVRASGPGQPRWRMLAPLRAAMRHAFAALDPAAQAHVHRLAMHAYIRRGARTEAVRHALAAGDIEPALCLVQAYAEELFQLGDWSQLAELVGLLPRPLGEGRAALLPWLALTALLAQRFDDCRRCLARLQPGLAALPAALRSRVHVITGMLAVHTDDMDLAASVFEPLRAMEGQADAVTQSGCRNVLAWIHIYRNEYRQAREVQGIAQAAGARAPVGTSFGELAGRCMSGFSLALEGHMNEAERHYREVLHACDRAGMQASEAAWLATGLLCEVMYELNDLDAVMGLEARLQELERAALPDTLLRVMLGVGRVLALRGRLPDAQAVMRRLEQYGRQRGLPRLIAYSLLEQVSLSLRRADVGAARRARAAVMDVPAATATPANGVLAEVRMVADRADILLLLHEVHMRPALARIQRLLADCIALGRRRRVAALHFQLAIVHRDLGEQADGEAHCLAALEIGSRLGLVRSLLDADARVPDLLEWCRARLTDGDPRLGFHADLLCAAAGTGPLAHTVLGGVDWTGQPARIASPGGLTEREQDVVQLLAQALPNKKIAREMGVSPETVKWHLSNIYTKLGVATRDEAVALVRDLG